MLYKFFVLVSLSFLLTNSWANTESADNAFDLFDSDRGQEKIAPVVAPIKQAPPEIKPLPPKVEAPKIQRDFELLGTSQIGSRFTAIMRAPNGKKLIQSWKKDRPIPIQGYTDYVLARIDPRRIQIAYPDSAPCRTSKPQIGLSCHVNGRMATLTMKRGKPTARQLQFDFDQPLVAPKSEAELAKQAVMTEDVLKKLNQPNKPAKPLTEAEIAKRKKADEDRRELYKNFKRRIIKDEDVPPGQRVIRTPFGDRLVPIK